MNHFMVAMLVPFMVFLIVVTASTMMNRWIREKDDD